MTTQIGWDDGYPDWKYLESDTQFSTMDSWDDGYPSVSYLEVLPTQATITGISSITGLSTITM